MRIALIGSNGQLAHDLDVVLKECGHEVLGLSHEQVEVAERGSVQSALPPLEPDLAINTSLDFSRPLVLQALGRPQHRGFK